MLSVNFRGSTGFGKAFVNAADREWAGKMHDDLIDAVDWAIAQRIADPERVAIYGASYGGYAALVGATFTPEKFACAVDIVRHLQPGHLHQRDPALLETVAAVWKARMGDHTTEEGRKFLAERSPLTHVDRIVRPLLIGQGANDVRVTLAESDQIVAAMQRRNIPVTYLYSATRATVSAGPRTAVPSPPSSRRSWPSIWAALRAGGRRFRRLEHRVPRRPRPDPQPGLGAKA